MYIGYLKVKIRKYLVSVLFSSNLIVEIKGGKFFFFYLIVYINYYVYWLFESESDKKNGLFLTLVGKESYLLKRHLGGTVIVG